MSISLERQPVPLARILRLAVPELRLLTIATVALIISSGMGLVYPQAVKWMVDAVVTEGNIRTLDSAALILVALFFVQSLFTMLRSWLFTVAGERVVARLRTDLYRAIIHQDIGFFDAEKTGELTNRLAADTTVLQNTVTVNVSMALRFTVGALGGLAMLAWMSPLLTGVAMAVVPVVAIAAAFYGRLIRRLSGRVQDALASSTDVAQETIAGIRTVRSFARENEEVERYGAAVDRSYRLAATRAAAVGVFAGTAGFAGYCAIALVIWWGGHLVIDPTAPFTLGDLTAFLLYTLLVAVSVGQLSTLYGDFMRAAGASERIFQLLDHCPQIEARTGPSITNIDGDLRFEHVHFAYPTRSDVPVLDDFNLSIPAGQVTALVGPSGSGKSTVAALLARFYDPQAGRVVLDDQDIRDVNPQSLRQEIGTVSQEPILFATSISENIRYGQPNATAKQVQAAAIAANANTFIESFPEGYATLVGERGIRLSGGQKQRIAIARAVLKDPSILVLDEATSALDAENEHLVQEALERLMRGRTTVIIAHRLSTIQDAEQVVVLDGGKIVEQGPHSELIERGGLYRRLVERQFGDRMLN